MLILLKLESTVALSPIFLFGSIKYTAYMKQIIYIHTRSIQRIIFIYFMFRCLSIYALFVESFRNVCFKKFFQTIRYY